MNQTYPGSAFLSQRAVVLVALIGLHVLLAYFLASGLGTATINILKNPMVATFVEEPPQPPPPTPPADPNLVRPVIDVGPVPEIPFEQDGDTGTALAAVVTPPDTGSTITTMPPQPEPLRLVGKHRLPNTEDYYPPDLRRRGIEGAANVRVCVDERGDVQGVPSVEKSSGNPRLDEGAVNVARNGHYARAMQGAVFVANCYGFRVIFQMR